ncbi:LysE family translocator [Plantactinospora endophytica]|uniref:Lysine transporter LysE n=1 Tax=Plantactinospora endophytica TaxID=673535 RepID=A0ABQ4E1X0_9ACTN|nr:LysE family translocator [Plantactinospora endophytica]GIG88701.1 lysine transporter LysE [Plantactinospora endophytica]
MDLALVGAFVVAVFLLTVAPGPDMLFVVANALAGGRRAGLVAALGMSTGLALHTFAAALGLSALLAAAPQALDAVRLLGAAFLVYLAVNSWRSARTADGPTAATVPAPRRPLRKVYLLATLTNVGNPKIVLFYLAFLPQFLTTSDPAAWPVWTQLLVLGAVFIGVGLPVDAVVGLTAGSLAERLFRWPSFRRRLERISALIFGGLAVRLLLDARNA